MSLLESIVNAQNGAIVRQLATTFQLDEDQAKSALGALVPALGRGLAGNAGSPQGLDDLIGALSRGGHGRYIDDPVAAVAPDAVNEGNGILGHVFGSKEVSREVAAKASDATGIDTGILKQMLPMLASLAMGAMAKQGMGGMATGTGNDKQSAGLGDMLTGLLDADKDGSIVDDVMGLASRFLR